MGRQSSALAMPSDGQVDGSASREGTANGTGPREVAGSRGMGVYDRDMRRLNEDEDGGHGGRKGFWASLCCKA